MRGAQKRTVVRNRTVNLVAHDSRRLTLWTAIEIPTEREGFISHLKEIGVRDKAEW